MNLYILSVLHVFVRVEFMSYKTAQTGPSKHCLFD